MNVSSQCRSLGQEFGDRAEWKTDFDLVEIISTVSGAIGRSYVHVDAVETAVTTGE